MDPSDIASDRATDTVTIMDMPDLVMRKILEDVDFISMMNLRKVNRAFQYFIDDTQLKFNLYELHLAVGDCYITLFLKHSETKESSISKIYFMYINGKCVVSPYRGDEHGERIIFCGSQFWYQLKLCLDGILKNQRSNLKILDLHVHRIPKSPSMLESIMGFFTSKKHQKYVCDPNNLTWRILDIFDYLWKSGRVQIDKLEILNFNKGQARRLVSILKPKKSTIW